MAGKRFDKQLFDLYDKLGKDAAKKYYQDLGHRIDDNTNKYGPDLLLYISGVFNSYIECEVKRKWIGHEFPSEIVRFPERKSKYLTGEPIKFFMTNIKGDRALLVEGKQLKADSLKEFKNSFVPSGELFYHVDLDNVIFVDITGSVKEKNKT